MLGLPRGAGSPLALQGASSERPSPHVRSPCRAGRSGRSVLEVTSSDGSGTTPWAVTAAPWRSAKVITRRNAERLSRCATGMNRPTSPGRHHGPPATGWQWAPTPWPFGWISDPEHSRQFYPWKHPRRSPQGPKAAPRRVWRIMRLFIWPSRRRPGGAPANP